MKKTTFSRNLFLLSLLTAMTVFTWIAFDVYRAFTKVEIPQVLQEQLEPLNPEIEKNVFEDLSQRILPGGGI